MSPHFFFYLYLCGGEDSVGMCMRGTGPRSILVECFPQPLSTLFFENLEFTDWPD